MPVCLRMAELKSSTTAFSFIFRRRKSALPWLTFVPQAALSGLLLFVAIRIFRPDVIKSVGAEPGRIFAFGDHRSSHGYRPD